MERTANAPSEMSKDSRIEAEIKRLLPICTNVGSRKKKVMEGLIRRAAYMRITLEDYEADLDEKGYVEMFCQSDKQEPYERERPVARLYNTMNKNYQSIIKQLADCIVESPKKTKSTASEYQKFLEGRDDGG